MISPVPTAPQQEFTRTDANVYKAVQEYYGKDLCTANDLKTSACTAGGRPAARIREVLSKIPQEVLEKFYGCGTPLPLGIEGLRVLDLGSGSGRDCFICAALVGERGLVTGIDMTEEQIQVAERHADVFCQQALGYAQSNLRFVRGHIEYLERAGLADSSQDVVISNCVVNLSPNKARVLQEVYRVLAPGGEFYFSDLYKDRRLPEATSTNKVLWGEGILGALYVEDFKRLAQKAGFTDPRVLHSAPITNQDPEVAAALGNVRLFSITFRLFKLPGLLEAPCQDSSQRASYEDYGQLACYKGTIPGHEHSYQLDEHHLFETGRPVLVCGNTAAMLGEAGPGGVRSWLALHFKVTGDRTVHYGLFHPRPSTARAAQAAAGAQN